MLIFGFERYGGPEVTATLDVKPPPSEHLVVSLVAASVNPADIKVRSGLRQGKVEVRFPMAMGREAAGVVVHDPQGRFAPDQLVFGSCASGFGALSELVALDPQGCAPVPPGVTAEQAACLPVAAGTAWDALAELALPPGSSLLVVGAGGGVGSHAIQLARHLGVRVVGVASESKADLVQKAGAEHVTSGPGWVDRVRAVLPGGADALLDCVGGHTLRDASEIVRHRERLRSAADPARASALGGSGVTRRRSGAVYAEVAELVCAGVVRPVIETTLPFERAADAVALVEEGHARGKVVVLRQ